MMQHEKLCETCGARLHSQNKQGQWREVNREGPHHCPSDRCDYIVKLNNGYLYVKLWTEEKTFTFWRALHRVIVENHIARKSGMKKRVPLNKRLQIHHKDGNRYNNEISNLEIVSGKYHTFIHQKEQVQKKMDNTLIEILKFEKQMKEMELKLGVY